MTPNEPFILTDSMMTKGGLVIICGYLVIWIFQKLFNKLFKDDSDKSDLLTKERQEFKESIIELRSEINSLHVYIRTEHKDTIDKNTTAYNNMCLSHTQLCSVISDLSKNMKERRALDKDK